MKQVFLVSSTELAEIGLDVENTVLIQALEERGIKATIQYWNVSSVDWSKADLVISRNTSSYIINPEQF